MRSESESTLADTTFASLKELTSEGIFATGGQLAVIVKDGLVVNIGVGQAGCGAEMTSNDLHNIYCIFKPMPYLLLGNLLEFHGFEPDDPLNEIACLPSWAPDGLNYRNLATHNAGLADPSPFIWRTTPPGERQELLNSMSTQLSPAYSEISGGLIIEHIIEELTGRTPSRYCAEELLRPLGLADCVLLDAESAMAAHSRIRVPAIGLPVDPLPMLTELLPTQIDEVRLAIGAFATMRDIARLYAAVGEVIAGNAQPGLPSPALLNSLLDDNSPLRHDPVLGRPAKWAAGLMTDVNLQGISQAAGPGTVAHTAGLVNSVALHDPSRRTSISLYLNGVGAENDDHIIPRQQLIDTILNAVPAN